MSQKVLLHYAMTEAAGPGRARHFAAHRARMQDFYDAGHLVGAGPVGVPPTGALGIFNSRAAVAEFVASDPFVLAGLIATHRIEEGNPAFL